MSLEGFRVVYWGYIGIMENQMETTLECWGYIGIMEKKMEILHPKSQILTPLVFSELNFPITYR